MTEEFFKEDATMDLEVQDPFLGRVLQGKYEISKRLGSGGMGTVYEAKHKLIGKRVAVKFLHAHFAADPLLIKRFRREAEAAVTIAHPNIIEVSDLGAEDGSLFMVLELLDGEPLNEHLKRHGPLPLGRASHLLRQMCDALAAAHSHGIVHRDLKPENAFVLRRGDDPYFVKLLDFGIAKVMEKVGGTKLTQSGAAMGTPYYMAPEQAGGKKVDHRADIFSLGVMAYEMLAGALPFEGDSYPALLIKVCTEEPVPIQRLRPDLPDEAAGVLAKMLAKSRDDRFSSCSELRDAWTPFLDVMTDPEVAPASRSSEAFEDTQLPDGAAPPGTESERGAGGPENGTRPLGTPLGAPVVGSDDSPTSPERSRRAVLGLAGAGLALAAVGLVAFLVVPAPEVPASPTEDVPAASPEAPVRLEISVQPLGAEVTLDGRVVSNPFDGELAPSDEPHAIAARLAGYQPETREILLTEAREVRLSLEPETVSPEVGGAEPAESETPARVETDDRRRRRPERPRVRASAMTPEPEPAPEPARNDSPAPAEPVMPQPPTMTTTTTMVAPEAPPSEQPAQTPLKRVMF